MHWHRSLPSPSSLLPTTAGHRHHRLGLAGIVIGLLEEVRTLGLLAELFETVRAYDDDAGGQRISTLVLRLYASYFGRLKLCVEALLKEY